MFESVYVTAGSEVEAKNIVKDLLEKKLIACANLFPITSYYYWDNEYQEDSEIAIIMKTRSEIAQALIKELKKIHSYDVPEILTLHITKGSKNYLSWLEKELKKRE